MKNPIDRDLAIMNLEGLYRLATDQQKLWGKYWYSEAQAHAKQFAYKYGISVIQAAGVIAALSPNNKWNRNLRDAENLIAAHSQGFGINRIRVGTYSTNKIKAWRILEGEDAHIVLKPKHGFKVWSFFHNIAHPEVDVVTIDGHAYNAAMHGKERYSIKSTPKIRAWMYAELSAIYSLLAVRYGLSGSEFQAIIWEVYRGLK